MDANPELDFSIQEQASFFLVLHTAWTSIVHAMKWIAYISAEQCGGGMLCYLLEYGKLNSDSNKK